MNKQRGFTLVEGGILVWVAVALALGIGWIMNVAAIVGSDFEHITGMLVLRVVGVFLAPLGGVLGYF